MKMLAFSLRDVPFVLKKGWFLCIHNGSLKEVKSLADLKDDSDTLYSPFGNELLSYNPTLTAFP